MDFFETGDRRFILVRGSDVERDGMYLELLDEETQRAVAEVFYSDASDAMTFTAYDEDLPLRAIERLIERGKELLAPTSSLRAAGRTEETAEQPYAAKLLTEPTNYAVVQLPNRQFPGVVFQGDSLYGFIVGLEFAAAEAAPLERSAALADVIERLNAIRAYYEAVLSGAGIRRPD
ncbi:DUF6959 family protein [Ensifer sp. 22521]|uniref:DUF6959 family protein n=1 Tax=Ensifer sp. 22521 TaxID=3453935 RepID=UPI003F855326